MTEQWGFNVGISGQYKGFKGGFDFGMKGFKKETNDYEYYMCYYKVEKAEMKLHTSQHWRQIPKPGVPIISHGKKIKSNSRYLKTALSY